MYLIKKAVIKYYLASNYSLKLEAAIKINSPYKPKEMSCLIPGHRDGIAQVLNPNHFPLVYCALFCHTNLSSPFEIFSMCSVKMSADP